MSTSELVSKYEFNMSGAIIEMGFTNDGQLFTKMMFVKKYTPLDSITTVNIKKGALSSKIQYDIRCTKNGKEKLFQIVQIDAADENGQQFVSELREKISEFCKWNDKLEEVAKEAANINVVHKYDLQTMWFIGGKHMAGQGRTLQLIMSYGMLTLVTIGLALPLLIYAFAAGCHRVTTDQNGIAIKKLRRKYFKWEEVDRIEAGKYNVVITDYGAEVENTFLIRFQLYSVSGKKVEFMIRSLEGKNFVREMIARNKMDEEYNSMFI